MPRIEIWINDERLVEGDMPYIVSGIEHYMEEDWDLFRPGDYTVTALDDGE